MYFRNLIFVLLLLTTACAPKNTTPQTLPEVHLPINNPNVVFLWSRYYPNNLLSATDDRVVGTDYHYKISAFDSNTGDVVWERKTDYTSEMVAHDSVVYAAQNNSIQALNAQNGDVLWNIKNIKTGNALSLVVDSEKILVQHQTGNPIIILDKVGKITKTLNTPISIYSTLIEGNLLYSLGGYKLDAVNINNNQIEWSVSIENPIALASIFGENILYVDSATTSAGEDAILAIDKSTRNVIWKWDKFANIISNLCPFGANIYFLTGDGYLIGLNKNSGEESVKLEFSNKPFTLYRSEEPQVSEYYVVADTKNNILIVAFGDSFQLMAIQFSNQQ